jgi:hypothetical protein
MGPLDHAFGLRIARRAQLHRDTERAAERLLPDPSWRFSTRLPRDLFVRIDTNDYSVNPRFIAAVSTSASPWTRSSSPAMAPPPPVPRQASDVDRTWHMRMLRTIRAEAELAAAPKTDTLVEERDLAVYERIAEAG